MLTMEEKERFLKTIEDVNDDENIIKEWISSENARWKHEGEIGYARDEGLAEGKEIGLEVGKEIKEIELIKNMLKKCYDYESISEITNKTLEEIENIANNMKE